MKSTYVALATFALPLLLLSCKKSNEDKNTPEPTNSIIVNTDAADLTKRISTDGTGVVPILSADKNGRHINGREYGVLDTSNQYPIELIASVAAPTYQGSTLKATHVDINGNYAYVSYNTEGDKYLGAVDVFDITTAATPKLVAEAIFPSTDINALVYNGNKLYITGASDVDKDATLKNPAIAGYVELSNNVPTGTYKIYNVPGYAGTDINFSNSKLYVTSGANGGLSVLDPSSFTASKYMEIRDLRSLAISASSKLSVYSGEKGVSTFNADSYTSINSFAPGADVAESKRTIDFYNENLLISGGKAGMLYYNAATGSKIDDILLPKTPPAGVDASDIVTNSVSNNNGLFFTANGAAGLYLSVPKDASTLALVGSMDLKGSANYVKSKGDYIYVASSTGLKILKFTKPATTTSCTSLPVYKGDANLNVNSNDIFKFSGAAALQNLNVGGSLYFCGAMSILYNCNINSGGTLEVHGTLAYGALATNNTLNLNSTLNIEGSLVIYGNLTLNSGAKLNFLGSGSTVTIYGKVIKNSGVTITGNYVDVLGKLK